MSRTSIPLLQFNNTVLTTSDLAELFIDLEIKTTDTLCVHTEIPSLGKPLLHKDHFFDELINTFKLDILKKGTLIMPTFTYSFCENQIYDMNNSRSTMGILTEYFRKSSDVKRTKDPIFSFAIWGRDQSDFLNIGDECFGKNSIYDKLYKNSGKLILFGSRDKGYTFFHYIEQMHQVGYRYNKIFSGTIIDENNNYLKSSVSYYVRVLDKKSIPSIPTLREFLIDTKNFKELRFANATIVAIDVRQFYIDAYCMLDKNIEYFLL